MAVPQGNEAIGERKWLLAVDTSAPAGGVALLSPESGEVLVKRLPAEIRTSRVLLPAIRDILYEANAREESLVAVAAALGPGSFTGLRIGLATVKGLVMGLGCPLYGISSLDAMADTAWRGWRDEGRGRLDWILPCRDARHGELFSALYRPGDDDWDGEPAAIRAGEDGVSRRDDLSFPGEGKILIAAAKNDRPETISEGETTQRVLYWDINIAPEGVARLARRAMRRGQPPAPPDLQPLYGRRPRAETMWSGPQT